LGIALFGLSGCISAVTPNSELNSSVADQTNQLAEVNLELGPDNSAEQLLARDENGNIIAIPIRNPHVVSTVQSVQLAGENSATTDDPVQVSPEQVTLAQLNPEQDSQSEISSPHENSALQTQNDTVVAQPGDTPAPHPPTQVETVQFSEPAPQVTSSRGVDIPHPPTQVETAQNSELAPEVTSSRLVGTQLDGTANPQNETTELALVVPQGNPRSLAERDRDEALQTPQAIASQQATTRQATAELTRPSFLARLFKRPPANVGRNSRARDDRNNPILKPGSQRQTLRIKPSTSSLSAMPGVKSNNEIFGIDKNLQNPQGNVQVASVTGLSRLSTTGIKVQHPGVDVRCIRPGVVRMLQIVERRYGKKPIVTSGYRSPSRNRKAGGARNSMHIFCNAVDIQVEGVSKWNLAKFLRSVPGRGGVGTYCRTKSVHIDTGSERDWNQRCRRKSKRGKRA